MPLAGRSVLLYLWRTQGGTCPHAVSRSLGKPGGTATTSSQRSWAGITARLIASFSTPSAVVNCSSRLSYNRCCVSQEAFGRLEPCELETLTHGS